VPMWALLQHVPYEGPGLIADQAGAHGIELDRRHLYRGDSVPDVEELSGLVVMGGPMGVGDTDAHPHLSAEIDLLAGAVDADVPVLGVCLGAQLLAHALGADVLPGAASEVGIGSVSLTAAGERDEVLGPAGHMLPVLHWHDDTFTLPPGADLLASSDRCVNQAFRAGRAYGLQFHIELDLALAKSMRVHLPAGVELPASGVASVEAVGGALLGRFFDSAQSARPARQPLP
jgi:GMP synthase-like glutamine amidotransferase